VRNYSLLVIGLFWGASGVYVAARPTSFIKITQYPWTKLPVLAARLLGTAILVVGAVMVHLFARP
jgi:predicted anti-sigma-YlaC factor YlaD